LNYEYDCSIRVAIAQSQGEAISKPNDWLLFVGYCEKGSGTFSKTQFDVFSSRESYQVLGRIRAADALAGSWQLLQVLGYTHHRDSHDWRELYSANFSAGSSSNSQWKPLDLFTPSVTEASLHFNKRTSEWNIVSKQMSDTRMQLCRSRAPEGPWRCEDMLEMMSPWTSAGYITYAGKAHPELTHDNDSGLVVSFVPNHVEGPHRLYEPTHYLAYSPKFAYVRVNE